MEEPSKAAPREASKLISCVLPDDGTHKALLDALHQERKSIKAEVVSALATGDASALDAKPGTHAGSYLARLVTVVVPAAEADAWFDFICEKARIDRDGGGVVFQTALVTSTLFSLPDDVAEEEG